MRTNAQGELVPASSGQELIQAIPALQQVAEVSTQQLCNVASAHLTTDLWVQLRQAIMHACADETVHGVVVVQGTDTLEETAFFLDASLSNEQLHDKPVIVTGAMRHADEPDGDGSTNLLNAVLIAADDSARERGVMVGMYGRLHAARYVRKWHTTRTDAFTSLEHPLLGEIRVTEAIADPSVPQSSVYFYQSPQRILPTLALPDTCFGAFNNMANSMPRASVVSTHISCDSLFIDLSIKIGAAAIIVEALGAGNVNPEISTAIEAALNQGVGIVIASRSPLGEVEPLYGYVGGGQSLMKMGAVFAHDLPAHKARIYAQLLLSQAGSTSHPTQILQQGFARLKS